jgi:SPP1 family predicted phage head-tail adaptor
MAMGAGRFDQRVTVKRPVYTVNDFGERVEGTPTVVGYRWAEIKPLSGNERDYAARIAAELSYQVTLRTPLDLEPTDRIIWGDRTLEIAAILDPPRSGHLMVQCKELT